MSVERTLTSFVNGPSGSVYVYEVVTDGGKRWDVERRDPDGSYRVERYDSFSEAMSAALSAAR